MIRSPKTTWLEVDNVFCGVSFKADFTAEHECGIKGLKRQLGVGETGGEGIKSRTITKLGFTALVEAHGILNLICEASSREMERRIGCLKENEISEQYRCYDKTLTGAWGEQNFIIRATTEEDKQKLHKLYNAFYSNNVAVYLGGQVLIALENAGLLLVIVDALPQKYKDEMLKNDLDYKEMIQIAEKTGIQKKIDEKNTAWTQYQEVENGCRCYVMPPHGYYALRPMWKENSKKKVVFWLNPINQDKNNSGWFTVEQLEQWLDGHGPVIKQNPTPHKRR